MEQSFNNIIENTIAARQGQKLAQELRKTFRELADRLNELDQEFNFVNRDHTAPALEWIKGAIKYNSFDGYFFSAYETDIQRAMPHDCKISMVEQVIKTLLEKELIK